MADVKVGDRLEDHEGIVWTVAEVFADAPPRYAVRLERVRKVVSEKWAGLDEIGPSMKRYRPVTEAPVE